MNRSILSVGSSGGSGGGGAATIADGADVTQGAIADAAVTGDNPGTVSAKFRGLTKILADVWDSVAHRINVTVGNFPATQPVSGTVGVNNFPATQPVSLAAAVDVSDRVARLVGHVSVDNFPATQPVSGTVGVNNFPATQPVSLAAAVDVSDRVARLVGHVSVDNFPATQPVSLAAAVDVSDRAARLVGHVTVDAITPPALTKGTQGATGYSVQELKDAGRTPIAFILDNVSEAASETLQTMSINKGGVVTSATSYTVTAGKTLRITSISMATINGSTSNASVRVRLRAAAALLVTSPIFAFLAAGPSAAIAQAGGVATVSFPDGIEFAAATQVGLTLIANAAVVGTFDCCVTGFEY